MFENKRGNLMQLPMILIMGMVAIAILVGLLPAIVEMINSSQQSDSLNCAGYTVPGSPALSYNASYPTSTMGCMFIKLTPAFMVLGVIFGLVVALLYGRSQADQYQ